MKAEFIWALPPAASDNSPYGGGDHIAGYAPLALVAENSSSQLELYWVHGNHLGVPVVTTNAQGQVVTPSGDFLRPGFPGQSEVLSDLYYNRARDYDPLTGRYIQADPIGLMGDVNPYIYANSDPVNLIDPLGLKSTADDLVMSGHMILIRQAGDALEAANAHRFGVPLYCFNAWEVGAAILLGAATTHPIGRAAKAKRNLGSLTDDEARVIQRFADRYGVTVNVVGSRAAGSANKWSDFDYILGASGATSRLRQKAKRQLPRGRAGGEVGPRGDSGIDVFNEPVDTNRPNIPFHPRPKR